MCIKVYVPGVLIYVYKGVPGVVIYVYKGVPGVRILCRPTWRSDNPGLCVKVSSAECRRIEHDIGCCESIMGY